MPPMIGWGAAAAWQAGIPTAAQEIFLEADFQIDHLVFPREASLTGRRRSAAIWRFRNRKLVDLCPCLVFPGLKCEYFFAFFDQLVQIGHKAHRAGRGSRLTTGLEADASDNELAAAGVKLVNLTVDVKFFG